MYNHYFSCLVLQQLTQRKEVCEHRATVARNDYVLNLGATNAHQQRFYGVDLPQLIKVWLRGDGMWKKKKGSIPDDG